MHQALKHVVFTLSAALLASACIVVPAENHVAPPPQNNAPPPPPPPPVYGDPQQPPPNYGQQQPPPQGYGQPGYTTTTTVVYYEDPTPEPVSYYEPSVIWYYGPHPVTPGYGAGWCPMHGGHTHNYEPYWQDRYEFYNGYYFYLGDPSAYDTHVTYYIYIGAHPNPWGGWCYATGEHRHYYTPRRNDPYRYENARWQYSGTYDNTYYSSRSSYDNNGHRTAGNAYADHRTYQAAHATPAHGSATHESVPQNNNAHGSGTVREGHASEHAEQPSTVAPRVPVLEPPPANNNANGRGPGLMLHGGNPEPTPTPAPAMNRPIVAPTPTPVMNRPALAPAPTPTPASRPMLGGHPAAQATPTSAPAASHGPQLRGGGAAATPTPAPAAGPGRIGHGAAAATPTPTPKARGRLP